jgi:hypothetical protein
MAAAADCDEILLTASTVDGEALNIKVGSGSGKRTTSFRADPFPTPPPDTASDQHERSKRAY